MTRDERGGYEGSLREAVRSIIRLVRLSRRRKFVHAWIVVAPVSKPANTLWGNTPFCVPDLFVLTITTVVL